MIRRSLLLHGGLLALSGALAARSLFTDESVAPAELTLWRLDPTAVQRLEYDAVGSSVVLERQTDEAGAFYRGLATTASAPPRAKARSRRDARGDGDAGVGSPLPSGGPPVERRFVAAEEVAKVLQLLAPLRAKRALGHVPSDRLGEFGLAERHQARLVFTTESLRRELYVGDKAPGSADVFVRTPEGEVYVIDGTLVRELRTAASRLPQRGFHTWKPDAAVKLRIASGGTVRELVRIAGERFWADPESPAAKDEAASNWLVQLEQLRVTRYPLEPVKPLLLGRVDFYDTQGLPLGFLELATQPGERGPEFFGRSETTREYGHLLASSGEALARDLRSLLRHATEAP